jgi:hypothetical protein
MERHASGDDAPAGRKPNIFPCLVLACPGYVVDNPKSEKIGLAENGGRLIYDCLHPWITTAGCCPA